MNPAQPLPQDLGEVPAWLGRIASWANAQLVVAGGPQWVLQAELGALVVAGFVALASVWVIRIRRVARG